MKKIVISILVIGLLGGLATAFYMWNKPKRTAADEAAVATLSADDLFMQYSENEANANKAYLDKIVQVSGVVASTDTDESGLDVVYLETSDIMGLVSCTFARDNHPDVAAGASVEIKGICTGILTDVVLTQSTLVH